MTDRGDQPARVRFQGAAAVGGERKARHRLAVAKLLVDRNQTGRLQPTGM